MMGPTNSKTSQRLWFPILFSFVQREISKSLTDIKDVCTPKWASSTKDSKNSCTRTRKGSIYSIYNSTVFNFTSVQHLNESFTPVISYRRILGARLYTHENRVLLPVLTSLGTPLNIQWVPQSLPGFEHTDTAAGIGPVLQTDKTTLLQHRRKQVHAFSSAEPADFARNEQCSCCLWLP